MKSDFLMVQGFAAEGQEEASSESAPMANHGLYRVGSVRFLGRLRYQLLIGVLITVALPPLLYFYDNIALAWLQPQSVDTTLGALAAFIFATYLFRRASAFPGVGIAGHVFPAVTAGYALVLAIFFALRLEYSRFMFGMSFTSSIAFFFFVSAYLRNLKGQAFYIVPSESTTKLPRLPHIQWVILREPKLPDDPHAVLIADLRADLSEEWERLIAKVAVMGRPVYHIKQVRESITGRVTIDHLSENSFGSLIPNLNYRKIKRLADLFSSLILLPLLLLPGLIVALAIKSDSPGPVFFRQKRRGYRGELFEVVKFRTMAHGEDSVGTGREHAITLAGDVRITRVGRFLRRTRIDELPQIWNVIKGEMSWIGPRPEAISLSEWYETELPFYSYRHIVRPGITGWAQVNQGHVADLHRVHQKLHYDFFYIKNFSAWLDLLILWRTIVTVFSGFGAR
jgi:lipopolysaccharide/colanic/teichoic acid biosynthesis glycosyltransferase